MFMKHAHPINISCCYYGVPNQRTLEHLEWKLLGDFSKSKANGDRKKA